MWSVSSSSKYSVEQLCGALYICSCRVEEQDRRRETTRAAFWSPSGGRREVEEDGRPKKCVREEFSRMTDGKPFAAQGVTFSKCMCCRLLGCRCCVSLSFPFHLFASYCTVVQANRSTWLFL
ncbi:unnamed protein product, partial [Ectocarpus sp. 13 AM-2016]